MRRFEERKQDLLNATERLKEALKQEENDIVIDCVLHRFEFTFELAWKSMKDFLEYNGISENIGSPREILRRAFESHLIEDGEEWINMMLARNSLSHLYDEETSRKIYKEIKEKLKELKLKTKETNGEIEKSEVVDGIQQIVEKLKKQRNRTILHLYKNVYRLKRAFPAIDTKEIREILNKKIEINKIKELKRKGKIKKGPKLLEK